MKDGQIRRNIRDRTYREQSRVGFMMNMAFVLYLDDLERESILHRKVYTDL